MSAQKENLKEIYQSYLQNKKNLNMARGCPSADQLDWVYERMQEARAQATGFSAEGQDLRNYGGYEGVPEMRAIFADILDTDPENVYVIGNSSLALMYQILSQALLFPLPDAKEPWFENKKRKFLCPVPGYDRHFAITEHLNFEMVPIRMTEAGPDMDEIERLCASDPDIKGIWCVPKYSNPGGVVYSKECCERLAKMKAADDFLIMWDNAYGVHSFTPEAAEEDQLPDMLSLCAKAGHPNRVFEFASSSKITYAQGGVACLAALPDLRNWWMDHYKKSCIGPDKMVQQDHVLFFEITGGVRKVMAHHGQGLKEKFELVENILEEELGGSGLAEWSKPRGGYFILVTLQPHQAKRVVDLCAEAGLKITPAGSTFPYKKDPEDCYLRLAPSLPDKKELSEAIHLFCLCVKLAAEE